MEQIARDVEVTYSGQVDFYGRGEGWTESFYDLTDEDQFNIVGQLIKGNPYNGVTASGMELDCEAHFLIYCRDITGDTAGRSHHMNIQELPSEVRESIIWNVLLDPQEQKQMRYSDIYEGEALNESLKKSKKRELIEAIEDGKLKKLDRLELQTLKSTSDFFFDKLCEECEANGKEAAEDYANWLVSISQLFRMSARDLTDYAEQYCNSFGKKKERENAPEDAPGKEEEKKKKYYGR